MERGVCEGNAILVQVIAYGDFSTECVAPGVEVYLVVLVVTSLYENRHIQLGTRYGVDNTNLKAEVRQGDDDAVNLITVLAEELGTLLTVGNGLHGASCRCVLLVEDDITVTCLCEVAYDSLADINGEVGIEIGAGTYDETEGLFSRISCSVHSI